MPELAVITSTWAACSGIAFREKRARTCAFAAGAGQRELALLLPSFAGPRLFRTVLRFRGHLEGGVTPSAVPAKPQNGEALRDHPTKDGSSSARSW